MMINEEYSYVSPLSYRYGTANMRRLWSEGTKRLLWRRVWLDYARARKLEDGTIDALEEAFSKLDLEEARRIEAVTRHDLVAELQLFARQSGIPVEVIHGALTSSDIQDNAEVLRQRKGTKYLVIQMYQLFGVLSEFILATADLSIMGWTHLQRARPTTLGYRAAAWSVELIDCHAELRAQVDILRGKGLKGPVGTRAGIPEEVEEEAMRTLDLQAHPMTGQIYGRVQDYRLLTALAGLAAALSKVAFDMRIMKSQYIILTEPPEGQVGSSSMPEKINPIAEEKVCSLGRMVESHASVAWHNAANNLLERTLDDSANRRMIIPETFIMLSEMLSETTSFIDSARVQPMIGLDLLSEGRVDVGDAVELAFQAARALKQISSRREVALE